MNTDDRALADLIARLRAMTDSGGKAIVCRDRTTRELCTDITAAADRLEAFHAKPVVGERQNEREAVRDYLLACSAEAGRQRLNMLSSGHKMTARDCGSESKAYANAATMIEREDHASYRAALQSPPPVVSGEAKKPSHLSVIPVKGHPEKHAVYDAIMGDAIAVCPDEIAAQMVFDALTKADTPPVVEEGRREVIIQAILNCPGAVGFSYEQWCGQVADAILALTPVEGVGMRDREYWARVLHDAWPHTVISEALSKVTGVPIGTVLTWEAVKEAGADCSGLYRYADAIVAALSTPVAAQGDGS